MNDVHKRAILLIAIGVLSIGSAVGIHLAGATGSGPSLLTILGMVAFGVAIYILLYAWECQPGTDAASDSEASGETMEQREEVCAAWSALPEELRKDERLTRLYRALGGARMDDPAEAATAGAGGNDGHHS